MTDENRPGRADWQTRLRSVATGFGLAIAGFVAANLLAVVAFSVLLGAGVPLEGPASYLLVTVVMGVAFVAVVVGYVAATDRRDLLSVRRPTRRDLGWAVAGLVALLVALVAVSFVFDQLGVRTARHRVEDLGRDSPELLLAMVPLAFLVIGPSEELLFRGAVQGVLREAYRPVPAIAIASVVFGLAHVVALSGPGKAQTILTIVLLGAILGALYEHTDNVVVPALTHGAYNAVAFLQIYAGVTGA